MDSSSGSVCSERGGRLVLICVHPRAMNHFGIILNKQKVQPRNRDLEPKTPFAHNHLADFIQNCLYDTCLCSSSFSLPAVPFLISSSPQSKTTPEMPNEKPNPLELAELLDRLTSPGQYAKDVEANLHCVSANLIHAELEPDIQNPPSC